MDFGRIGMLQKRETMVMNEKRQKINWYEAVWLFTIASIFGYILETFWYFTQRGYWLNRQGMVYGPFSQIYGFGALIICYGLGKLAQKNSIYIFLGSFVLGSVFEYAAALFQESAFGVQSWNYDNQAFNLHGRISLRMAITWGFVGVVFIRHTYPWLMDLIHKIPLKYGEPVARMLIFFFVFNLSISTLALLRQEQRRDGIQASNAVAVFLDQHYPDSRLESIYTTAKPVNN